MTQLSRRQILAFLAATATFSPPLNALAGSRKVIVIGAGIAGLAAGEALLRYGAEVKVLEARNRIGGRALSDVSAFQGEEADLGAWRLHSSSNNALASRLESSGNQLVPVPENDLLIMNGKRMNTAQAEAFHKLVSNIDQAIETMADRGLRLDRLKPQSLDEKLALTLIGANRFGTELRALDAADMASFKHPAKDDAMLAKGGLGAALVRMFRAVPVEINTAATTIAHDDKGVRITTDKGQTLEADAVIVTAPPPVISSGRLKFTPALPPTYQQAFHDLPLGLLNTITLQFSNDLFGDSLKPNTPLRAVTTSGDVIDARLRQGKEGSLVSCFVGGDLARQLEQQGDSAALNYALSGLADLFGSNINRAFIKGKASRWGRDPWIMGSLSTALPGKSEARSVLINPVGRILFAGDALASPFAGTLTGAYESGRNAAAQALRGL